MGRRAEEAQQWHQVLLGGAVVVADGALGLVDDLSDDTISAILCEVRTLIHWRHLPDIELGSHSSGSNVIPRRARPGLAGLRPHSRPRRLSDRGARETTGYEPPLRYTGPCRGM